MTQEQEIAPPPRFLLRPAGVLTQILCAFSLLLGTISFILVQQNKTGGAALVIVWAIAAMAGVVFGGLMSRGGLVSVIASALIVGVFGTVLLVIDWDALRSMLRLLPEDDVAMIADILVVVAIAMIATSVLSLASIPQARAYNRALREAESEAQKSGFFEAQPSGELPRQVQVPITLPPRGTLPRRAEPYGDPHAMDPSQGTMPPLARGPEPVTMPRARTTSPVAVPPPPVSLAPGMTFRAGAGSSNAHTSSTHYPGAPQSPAMPPAYRDATPPPPAYPDAPPSPAYRDATPPPPAYPGAPPSPAYPDDGPPSMPSPASMPSPVAHDGPPSMPPPLFGGPGGPSMPGSVPGSLTPGRVSDRNLPLPAPPPSADGYAPPRPSYPPAAPPVEDHIPASASTAPGWTPSPARTYTTMMTVRPPKVEQRSRRRVYMMLGGFAIGLGAGVGVLVSSMQDEKREQIAASTGSAKSPTSQGSNHASSSATTHTTTTTTNATNTTSDPASVTDAAVVVDAASAIDAPPPPPLHNFLDAQRDLIGVGDLAKLAQTFAPSVFGFGIDADDVAEGRDAVEAMLTKNLGDPPPDGFKVTSKFVSIGQEGTSAWTAEEIELSGPNLAPRRIVITQLAVATDGAWSVLALCWAQTVRDETAERLAILGTLPKPRAIADRVEGELGAAAKAAFVSRKAFADARSERDDAFNFGSGPGERIVGGAKIKALFTRLRAELRQDGGMRVVTAGSVGFAALDAVYTQKGRAATDVSQTFRVLAVFLKEGTTWKIVQTQFSNAGPIDE